MQKKPTQTSVPGSRREFLKQTAIATAAVAAAPLLRPTVYGQAPSAGKVLGANDRFVIGYIGVGNQGLNIHVGYLKKSAAANNTAQAAVCDVWTKRVGAAKTLIEKDNANAKVDTYGDYQKLL